MKITFFISHPDVALHKQQHRNTDILMKQLQLAFFFLLSWHYRVIFATYIIVPTFVMSYIPRWSPLTPRQKAAHRGAAWCTNLRCKQGSDCRGTTLGCRFMRGMLLWLVASHGEAGWLCQQHLFTVLSPGPLFPSTLYSNYFGGENKHSVSEKDFSCMWRIQFTDLDLCVSKKGGNMVKNRKSLPNEPLHWFGMIVFSFICRIKL